MDPGPAEFLGTHLLAGRRLHERRAAEVDGPGALDDDGLVAHGGDVGAAGRAHAHDRCQLRDAAGAHHRLVAEDPAEVVAVGEDLGLERQERAPAVHQVHAGQLATGRDLLGAEVFLDGQRVVGPALHAGVVRDHHDQAARNRGHPGDQASGRSGGVVTIVRGERSDLQKRRTRIGEPFDPLPHEELPLLGVAGPGPAAAPLAHLGEALLQRLAEFAVMRLVGPELVGLRRDVGLEPGQTVVS